MVAPKPQCPPVDVPIYAVGQTVSYEKFGRGTVTEVQPDKGRVTVDFIVFGSKTLSVEKARLTILDRQ